MEFVKTKLANKEIIAIVLISLAGFFVRLAFLTTDRFLTYDEAWTLAMAKANVSEIINGSLSALNFPLHFLFLHLWLKIDQGLFFLRLSSVLVGSVTIPFMWFVAKKLLNSKAALISSLLVAFSPAFIFESTNLRMYALGILESLLIIYFFWQFLKSQRFLFLFALSLTLLLGLYTQQYFGFIALSLNLFFLLNLRKYRSLRVKWFFTQIVIFLLLLPILWLSLALPPIKLLPFSFSFWKIPSIFVVFAFSWDALQILNLFPFKPSNFLNLPVLLSSTGLLFAFLFGFKFLKKSKDLTKFFLIYLFLPLFFVSLISILFRPIFGVRSFIVFSPAYYLVAALGLSKLKPKFLGIVTVIFLSVQTVFLINEYLGFRKTQASAKPYAFVNNQVLPQDVFIHSDPYTLVLARAYLNDRQFAILPSWFSSVTESAIGYDLISPEELPLKGKRFWYFLLKSQYYNRDLATQKQKEFEEKYQTVLVEKFEEGPLEITLFDLK